MDSSATAAPQPGMHSKRLFWGCFIALIATSFGFVLRALTANEWGAEFRLSETQVGEILGAGLWPFAISIVLFSLIIDYVGYKVAMWFGLVCHVLSTVLILMADSYSLMYAGTFILALGSGTVEAYINPVVATVFRRDKTKWLNILHAGWPGGLVLGGILAIALGTDLYWKYKIALILIPTVVYAVMLFNEKFPVHERVAAGVSYRDMLREVGAVGALIIATLVVMEVGRVFGLGLGVEIGLIVLLTGAYAAYTRAVGRPLFILFLLIMMPLATTELGVDSWITALMENEMTSLGIAAGWVLVYTSAIMMTLRFSAGAIVHRISPLGLLAVSAAIACLGLLSLSVASGIMILLAATLYGIGKSFFWPTTLGVVAEQFPKGGALTLNAVAGVGMLAVGIVGAPFLGYIQDISNVNLLQQRQEVLAGDYAGYVVQKDGLFGAYDALNVDSITDAPIEDQDVIREVRDEGQKDALRTVAIFPVIMLLFYIGLIFYFRSKGGYKPVDLEAGEDRPVAATA